MRSATRRCLVGATSLVLAACSGTMVKPRSAGLSAPTAPPHPAIRAPAPPAALPAVSPPIESPPIVSSGSPIRKPDTVWTRLRASFAMPGCAGDPQVVARAKQLTADPHRFEQHLRTALPRLVYVQSIAARHRVAGEFVLLPWVESHFEPVRAHHHRPAGMWQIMPVTASKMGLPVNRAYDGRLNLAASTEAVMGELRQYQDQLGDWRLTDYAYNAGEFAIRKLVARHGAPPPQPEIPQLPVKRGTREHLVRLLAIACVVRDPQRFGVSLPTLPGDQHLVAVPLKRRLSIKQAAGLARMPAEKLRRTNSASNRDQIDTRYAKHIMLPANRVSVFHQSLQTLARGGSGTNSAAGALPLPSHEVKAGETLWEIARRYSLSLDKLLHWNHLHDSQLQIGQVLLLASPR